MILLQWLHYSGRQLAAKVAASKASMCRQAEPSMCAARESGRSLSARPLLAWRGGGDSQAVGGQLFGRRQYTVRDLRSCAYTRLVSCQEENFSEKYTHGKMVTKSIILSNRTFRRCVALLLVYKCNILLSLALCPAWH
jgi:hypothetical protein